jgi:AraC-like DNA-binding protein
MGAVTSLFVHKMVAAAAGPGVDARAILGLVGLDPDIPPDPGTMIAATAYYDLLERIATLRDVTDLPLRTGASMRCDDYGALGLAFKAAPTLQGSYDRVARYARLWTTVVQYELRLDGANTWFMLHRAGPRRLGMRLSNEATLASATAIAREVHPEGRFTPLEVHIAHPAPRNTDAHTAYFGCPVLFGSDRDALLISPGALAEQNRLGDTGITRFLLSHLDRELAELTGAADVTGLARDAIARALSEGQPRMDMVARRLGMSARSLHRRLARDGLTFQALAEDTRRELAEGLLGDHRYSLAEIAFLTGFSEQSAFNRAFKRWVGTTPASYRRARVAAIPAAATRPSA